ncbi:MAG: HepT-like ribonuclease domain-containing protein [Promethearchaeota archaeon]
MKKNSKIFLTHILNSINLVEEYLKGKCKLDFLNSIQLQDSVIRRIEIIGEAIKNIPNDIKKNYNQIPWKEITGMRDILIHQYFGVDLDPTWQVIDKDLPSLKRQISDISKKID